MQNYIKDFRLLFVLITFTIILTNCESDSISNYLTGGGTGDENTPPIADFDIYPESGNTQTNFSFDASYCSDDEDETSVLQVRWDWENDGSWDTGFSTTKTATHNYPNNGDYSVKLEVKDSEGLTDQSYKSLSVTEGGSGGQNIIVFWTATENVELDVYINGYHQGTITQSYPEAPGCWSDGCVTYSTDEITITYRAESVDERYNWSEKTINLNSGCASMHLRINVGNEYEKGSMTDSRDGNTYNTVKIGDQWWMAQNLAYIPHVSFVADQGGIWVANYDGNSVVEAKATDYYKDWGCLYDWATGMALDQKYLYEEWGGSDENHQGLCPSGWHFPSEEDWVELEITLGMDPSRAYELHGRGAGVGKKIRLGGETGFEAPYAGTRVQQRTPFFNWTTIMAYFWTATEGEDEWIEYAWKRSLGKTTDPLDRNVKSKDDGLSIRCVKN